MTDPTRRTDVTLHGGPLDGTTITVDAYDPGIGIPSPRCTYPGGQSWYQPDYDGLWVWRHDIPPEQT